MPLTTEQGKAKVEALLRAEAEKQGVKLKDVRWRYEELYTNDPHILEASNPDTGRMESARFSAKHLTHYEEDNQIRFRVVAKVAGLVIQLKRRSQ